MRQISLTGIKPTGDLHIGNFFGAMRPALQLAESYEARYFIADYHALNSVKDAAELRTHIRAVAAGWLAAGLDPDKVIFYRQSAVPETFELSTLLMAFTAKGLMNRAHASNWFASACTAGTQRIVTSHITPPKRQLSIARNFVRPWPAGVDRCG